MIQPIPFRADRFRSAAPHYLLGRPAYAPRLIQHVAAFCKFGETTRLMDLGCGPGQLAIAFEPYVASVLAIDPDAEMLALAQEATNDLTNVELRKGIASDMNPDWGHFSAVVMGRSFHWMDRVDTLLRLDQQIYAGGMVILFSTEAIKARENAWEKDFKKLLEPYQDEPRTTETPGWVSHEAVLLNSAFSQLEELAVIERRTIAPQTLLDRAFSYSMLTPARLGDKARALRKEIEEFAACIAVDGEITEVVKSVALVARRP